MAPLSEKIPIPYDQTFSNGVTLQEIINCIDLGSPNLPRELKNMLRTNSISGVQIKRLTENLNPLVLKDSLPLFGYGSMRTFNRLNKSKNFSVSLFFEVANAPGFSLCLHDPEKFTPITHATMRFPYMMLNSDLDSSHTETQDSGGGVVGDLMFFRRRKMSDISKYNQLILEEDLYDYLDVGLFTRQIIKVTSAQGHTSLAFAYIAGPLLSDLEHQKLPINDWLSYTEIENRH